MASGQADVVAPYAVDAPLFGERVHLICEGFSPTLQKHDLDQRPPLAVEPVRTGDAPPVAAPDAPSPGKSTKTYTPFPGSEEVPS